MWTDDSFLYFLFFYFFPAAVIARVAASPRKYVSIIANRLLSIQMSLVGLEMCRGCATLRYVFYVRPSPLSFEKSHPKYKWQSVGGSFFFRCNHLLFLSQKGGEKKKKEISRHLSMFQRISVHSLLRNSNSDYHRCFFLFCLLKNACDLEMVRIRHT